MSQGPLVKMRQYKLVHGDCLTVMQKFPDRSIDLILCDLPYGTTACKWDTVIDFDKLWTNYNRIIKDDAAIVLFGSEPFSSLLRSSNLSMYRYDWIWDKKKPSNFQMMNFQPGRIHETISVFSKRPAVYCKDKHMRYYPIKTDLDVVRKTKRTVYGSSNTTLRSNHIVDIGPSEFVGKLPKSILSYTNANTTKRLHPTQKPIDLLSYLIKTYTKNGDLVLDSCMGSGSTGIACLNTGRRFFGIEKDAHYYNVALNRINIWKSHECSSKSTGQKN